MVLRMKLINVIYGIQNRTYWDVWVKRLGVYVPVESLKAANCIIKPMYGFQNSQMVGDLLQTLHAVYSNPKD